MPNPMNGHVFKVKDSEGNWIPVPVLVTDIYDAYVAFCEAQTPPLNPVSQTTYYETLGNLQTLVTNLDSDIGNINRLIEALDDGVLPLALGGLGVSIGAEQTYTNLKDFILHTIDYNLSKDDIDDRLNTLESDVSELATDKLDAADISFGTNDPSSTTAGKYYFQYTN